MHNTYTFPNSKILIGNGPTSTTVVPKMYTIRTAQGNKKLVDLPGFKDANLMVDAMISIFMKCILQSIKKIRFIIVINASRLEDAHFPGFRNEYYSELNSLFGDLAMQYLPDMYFVVT